jgi:hypothetical protein
MTKEKRVVWSGIWVGFSGTNVEQVCGGVQSFSPEFWWHGRVNEKSTDNIVEGAKRAFCLSVLRGGIWAEK